MAHIAIIISGLTGRLHSSFEMATRLREEGHTITYLCPKDVKDKVEHLGFSYVQLPPINFGYQDSGLKTIQASSWGKRLVYHIKNSTRHYEVGKRVLNLEEYETILKKVDPDRALIDMELHDIIFAAWSIAIPITLYTAWFSNKITLALPPLRSHIIPQKEAKGNTFKIFIAWTKVRLKVWGRLLVNKITFKNYRRAVLKKYAKQNGFPVHTLIATNMPPMFAFTTLPILTMNIKSLDFPHRPQKNIRYVGPMVFDKRDREEDAPALHHKIDKIIASKKKLEKKLIYCSVSSLVKGDIAFLQNVINAIAVEPNWILIMSLGGNIPVEEIRSEQDNIHLFPWVPQLKILAEADCSINHGGVNSINECIHFSVPMLVYSGKRFDQNGNAARIAYHELGIRGDKDVDTENDIHQKIKTVFSNPEFKEKMTMVHDIYKEYRHKKLSSFL